MSIPTKCAPFLAFALVAGCANTQQVSRYDGRTEYSISCGQAVDWNVCHDEAKKRCPNGYETLSQDIGFTAKELRVLCSPAPRAVATVSEPVSPASIAPEQPSAPPRKVFITSEPHSLLIEDMTRRLVASPALAVVDDRKAADIVLKAEAYNLDLSDGGSDTQHYALPKYLVPNIVAATFYMPDASSYNVDIQHFKAEAAFEFAYTVSTPSGQQIGQKVIRDRIEREGSQCSQPTVINAFGGVQPAQFWASDELQSRCSRPSERPSKSAMQSEAEEKIATEMRQHLTAISLPEPPKKPGKKARKKAET